jgi:hypothetical protein
MPTAPHRPHGDRRRPARVHYGTEEHISGMRWWRHEDIAEYGGADLFSPRDLASALAALIAGEIPDRPMMLGL